jgi:hypothetical protein
MESPACTFAAHAARGELAYQVDARGRPLWPPSVRGADWRVSSGRGTVYATTTIRGGDEEPHDLSLIDLDEGFRMLSTVRGGEAAIGTRVVLAWDDQTPVFEVER